MAIKVRVRTVNFENYKAPETAEWIETTLNEQLADGHGIAHVWVAGSILILIFAPQEPRGGIGQVMQIPGEVLDKLKRGGH